MNEQKSFLCNYNTRMYSAQVSYISTDVDSDAGKMKALTENSLANASPLVICMYPAAAGS